MTATLPPRPVVPLVQVLDVHARGRLEEVPLTGVGHLVGAGHRVHVGVPVDERGTGAQSALEGEVLAGLPSLAFGVLLRLGVGLGLLGLLLVPDDEALDGRFGGLPPRGGRSEPR
jgi:hypothetical protein